MKLIRIAFLFTVLTGFISRSINHENKMRSFEWMNGDWKMSTKKGTIVECWNTLNDSSMKCESVLIKNEKDTILLETVSLVFRNNNYYYLPVAKGQNNNEEVSFKITSFNDKSFVAENPEHDFPKRITYQLVNIDSIHAFIDGGPAMPDKKSNFYYSRIKD